MWRASPPGLEQIRLLQRVRERLDLYPLAIHASYLVNLASCDPVIRERSIAAFRGELERAAAIGAEYLVVHPGSSRGQPLGQAIEALALALRDAAAGWTGNRVTVLLENTVGCGAQIGGRFEDLRAIRDRAAALTDMPVGYCLDTCHLLAAGFEISSEAGLRRTVRHAEEVLGIANVKLIHANDSRAALGSRIDRHASIGKGHIGTEGFRSLLAHPLLRDKPFILETPVERPGDDRRNLKRLLKLCPKSRTTTTRSS